MLLHVLRDARGHGRADVVSRRAPDPLRRLPAVRGGPARRARSGLVPACSTPVQRGMEIETDAPMR